MPKKRNTLAAPRGAIYRYIMNKATIKHARGVKGRVIHINGKTMLDFYGKDKKQHFINYARNMDIVPRTADHYVRARQYQYPHGFKPIPLYSSHKYKPYQKYKKIPIVV
jgi:hypothetical protein